jgi:hypothetical protein
MGFNAYAWLTFLNWLVHYRPMRRLCIRFSRVLRSNWRNRRNSELFRRNSSRIRYTADCACEITQNAIVLISCRTRYRGGWIVEVIAEDRSALHAWPIELRASLARIVVRSEVAEVRSAAGSTQAAVARGTGTAQAAVARLERERVMSGWDSVERFTRDVGRRPSGHFAGDGMAGALSHSSVAMARPISRKQGCIPLSSRPKVRTGCPQ